VRNEAFVALLQCIGGLRTRQALSAHLLRSLLGAEREAWSSAVEMLVHHFLRSAGFVTHDRDRGLTVDYRLRHRVAMRAGEQGGHGVSVR
jgi:hypothetical protein